jgi:hypothetical protein
MSTACYIQPKLENLSCRVKLLQEGKDDSAQDIFVLEICGTIHSPVGCDRAAASISIFDITGGEHTPKPVHTHIPKWKIKNSQTFCYTANLGKLPAQVTTLSNWMTVARIPADCLAFPKRGQRILRFGISILSQENCTALAYAFCDFIYENSLLGYTELEENTRRAKIMAVKLAFVVAATGKKISAQAVEVIQSWVKNNTVIFEAGRITGILHKLIARMIASFLCCNWMYSHIICKKIANTAPMKVRCDILALCLRAAGADGTIVDTQLMLLKNMADWFGIHRENFRSLMESILPIRMYEVEDLEISLGITSDMDKGQL